MHRRQFLAASAALLLPSASAGAFQDTATPEVAPNHHGRPRPIVLGDGIELVDYRIYPSPDVPRIIGEITSTRDDMVDSPVVSITFPDLGEDGLAWAAPVLPVMPPGESNMIFGVLPVGISTEEQLQSAAYALCSPAGPGPFSELHKTLQLRIEILEEELLESTLRIEATIENESTIPSRWTSVRGLIRDRLDRLAGTMPERELRWLGPGQQRAFTGWQSANNDNPGNPFLMLKGETGYSVELHGGSLGPLLVPGCNALFE